MTYNEAYDKIIDAYFKDEIQPMDPEFCFCGTISPNHWWRMQDMHPEIKYPYSANEYMKMEYALFCGIGLLIGDNYDLFYEDALFKGMCAALEVLKQIHESRGEVVEEDRRLQKRVLV